MTRTAAEKRLITYQALQDFHEWALDPDAEPAHVPSAWIDRFDVMEGLAWEAFDRGAEPVEPPAACPACHGGPFISHARGGGWHPGCPVCGRRQGEDA